MDCPYCSKYGTRVLESRMINTSIRRRRECHHCNNRFTTYEQAVFNFTVIKRDGRHQPFNLEKIRNSLEKACGKKEESFFQELATKVERKILAKKKNPIKTGEIGKVILQELKKHDKMAYLHFAAVHKKIEDPKQLEKELKLLA
jgi:transcriptional repressor NrdR